MKPGLLLSAKYLVAIMGCPITTYALLLLISLGSPLLAQTPPVVTLSANTFYRGDAPGTYSIICPAGTNASVSVLTKIADVPLLDPSNMQYSVGVAFPWPSANSTLPTLTGTLPQSSTQSVMGNVIYNAGVLVGVAYCNAIPATNTTATSFTITLNGVSRAEAPQAQARVTYALKANSVKLPQLGTTEQNTLPPQQAGNLIYNADQQKLAVHNGSSWQYVNTNAPGASQFQNEEIFRVDRVWAVPSGVTRIMAEVWGGGAGGSIYQLVGTALHSFGGNAGGYARGFMSVTPGSSLTITVGYRGVGASRSGTLLTSGTASTIVRPDGEYLFAAGGSSSLFIRSYGEGTRLGFQALGGAGMDATVSYGQRSPTEYVLLIQCGNGGTAYGVQPGIGGIGAQLSSLNSSTLLYLSGERVPGQDGSYPGGGGGGGYNYGGDGADGIVVIRW